MARRGFPRELAGTFSEAMREPRQNHVEASQTLTSDKDPPDHDDDFMRAEGHECVGLRRHYSRRSYTFTNTSRMNFELKLHDPMKNAVSQRRPWSL